MTTHTPARRLLAAALILAGLLLSLLPGHRARAAVGHDTLVLVYAGAPATLDPAVAYDNAGPATLRDLYQGLVGLHGTSPNKVEGLLATSWSTNAAKTVWTFSLRRGVLFHDGTPFNAAAVKFSVARVLAINSACSYIFGQFMTPAEVQVVGPYTVRFHLHIPAPRFLYALSSEYCAYMVSPAAVKAHAVKNDWAQQWMSAHEAGTGPYMLSQYAQNQDAVLTKFPAYWGGWAGPHLRRVILDYVSADATRREMVEKGDADIGIFFTPEDLAAMQQNKQLVVDTRSPFGNYTLIPTVAGPFASPQARRALAYAFDYSAFIDVMLKGFARPEHGPLMHTVDGWDGATPLYPTDIARARALFAAAGVKPGTALTMWYNSADEAERDVALITQGQLAQAGLAVHLVGKDAGTYFNDLFGSEPLSRRPNLWVGGWAGDYNDAMSWFLPLYHSKTSNAAAGGGNAGLYHDPRVDQLIDRANVTVDPAARQRLLSKAQYILTVTDPAALYLAEEGNPTVYQRSLHGYNYNPVLAGTFDFYRMWK